MQHFVAVYWRAFEILRFFMSAKLNRAPGALSLRDRRYLISRPPVLRERGPSLSCPDQSRSEAAVKGDHREPRQRACPLTAARAKGTQGAYSAPNGCRSLALAWEFSLLFYFIAQFTAENVLQPLRRRICCFDQLPRDETCHQPMPLPIWCVVINQEIVGVSSRLSQALYGLVIRRGNRAQRHGLTAATHPNEDSSGIQVRVFCADE